MLGSRGFTYLKSSYGIKYDKLTYHSLHHAVFNSRVTQIGLLLKIHPELINLRTKSGLTPLMIACILPEYNPAKEKIIKLLIRTPNFDPYVQDNAQRSAVFYLIYFTNVVILNHFLEFTKFNYFTESDIDGFNLLHYAVERDNLDMLELLIKLFKKYKVDINPKSSLNFTPLQFGCKLGRYKSVCLLLMMGCVPLNIRDDENRKNWMEYVALWKNKNYQEEPKNIFQFERFVEAKDVDILPDINDNYLKLGPRSHSCDTRLLRREMTLEPTKNFSSPRMESWISSQLVQSLSNLTRSQGYNFIKSHQQQLMQQRQLSANSRDGPINFSAMLTNSSQVKSPDKKRVTIMLHNHLYKLRNNSPSDTASRGRPSNSVTSSSSGLSSSCSSTFTMYGDGDSTNATSTSNLRMLSSGYIAHRLLHHLSEDMFNMELDNIDDYCCY